MTRAMKFLYCYLENRIAKRLEQRVTDTRMVAVEDRVTALEKGVRTASWQRMAPSQASVFGYNNFN